MYQGLSTASKVDIELFGLVVIVVVSRVVGELVLDAWPWRAGVTAAEWDSINQVTSIYVTLDAAKKTNKRLAICVQIQYFMNLPTLLRPLTL